MNLAQTLAMDVHELLAEDMNYGGDFENQNPNVAINNFQRNDETKSRSLQQVCTKTQRKEVVNWMIIDSELNGDEHVISRAVAAFALYFRGQTKANLQKASRWWKDADKILEDDTNVAGCSHATISQLGGRRKFQVKTFVGRGRKRTEWVMWLYPLLLNEFERLRKSGIKFSPSLLIDIARHIIQTFECEFNGSYLDPKDQVLIFAKITHTWIKCFMDIHNIVILQQRRRLSCSPEKERQIEMLTTFHLDPLHRGFLDGTYNEDLVENMDETHFVINCDNGRTLGMRGDSTVRSTNVVSGGEAMTMVVRITGGQRAKIQAPMMIFTNPNRTYPIRNIPDNIEGVSYRTGPKGWMDKTLFSEWFAKNRAYGGDPGGRQKFVWVDNCSGHAESPELIRVLASTNTKVCYLLPCTTHLCQPADTFVISKIKDVWTSQWEKKKMELVQQASWQDDRRRERGWSGKLHNPGKNFFLHLAAESVRVVNEYRDATGLSAARKSMIKCGLSLDIDGSWRVKQLFPYLQDIIQKHPEYFAGEPVPEI